MIHGNIGTLLKVLSTAQHNPAPDEVSEPSLGANFLPCDSTDVRAPLCLATSKQGFAATPQLTVCALYELTPVPGFISFSSHHCPSLPPSFLILFSFKYSGLGSFVLSYFGFIRWPITLLHRLDLNS